MQEVALSEDPQACQCKGDVEKQAIETFSQYFHLDFPVNGARLKFNRRYRVFKKSPGSGLHRYHENSESDLCAEEKLQAVWI